MAKQTAKLNYLRIAPRKVRFVANLIKGLGVNEAEAQLILLRRRPAVVVLKLLRSAVANAKNNKLDSEKMYVESIQVDQATMLKRFLPRARGMATPIQKKTSHLTLVIAEKNDLKSPRFKIVVPKKVKLPPGETKRPKEKKNETKKEIQKPKKSGFFQKLFRRKAI